MAKFVETIRLDQLPPGAGTTSRKARFLNTEEKMRRKAMRKMNRITLARICMTLAVALVACIVVTGQEVRHNYMPGTDFSKYHTYKWVPIEGGTHPNQIMDAEIKQAVDAQMAAKGFSKTDGDKADLYVGYQIAVDQEKQWNGYGMGGGVRWGGMATATSSTINVGTMVLDMYDPASKQLVWTGNASKTIDPSSNQEKNQKNLNKAMQKLLKDFPPKQK